MPPFKYTTEATFVPARLLEKQKPLFSVYPRHINGFEAYIYSGRNFAAWEVIDEKELKECGHIFWRGSPALVHYVVPKRA